MDKTNVSERNWQLEHYARVGEEYGNKHFTQADSEFTRWILTQLASVKPDAGTIAEVGAGTCVFASVLGKKMEVEEKVVCYEPVAELLEGASTFDNVQPVCGGALEFAHNAPDGYFDLLFTKDTAHHFAPETLDEIHHGFCQKLRPGGRYVMVSRTPPDNQLVPVGRIASEKWQHLYTSQDDLLASLRGVPDWTEVVVERWENSVETQFSDWIDGVQRHDTWSVFSALTPEEIATTVVELEQRFADTPSFNFLHQYDVAVFEKG